MKLTLEQYDLKVTIESPEDLTVEEALEDLIKPSLLALGYSPSSVDCIAYAEPIDKEVLN